jgi:hypothetical protein
VQLALLVWLAQLGPQVQLVLLVCSVVLRSTTPLVTPQLTQILAAVESDSTMQILQQQHLCSSMMNLMAQLTFSSS